MFGIILRHIAVVGSLVSKILGKHGRYVPGLDEALEILKQVSPILAMSDHPDAPELAVKVNKVINKEVV